MDACVVCKAPASSLVWDYPVCREHEAAWRADVVPPAEHSKAGEVPHEALCAAWKAATRAFLVERYRERQAAEKVAPRGSQGPSVARPFGKEAAP